MTNNWADLGNGTLFVVMGANPVENHPASAAHMLKAVDERGAKIIVIDPRKTRTAVLAEAHGGRYIRHRPGTDIAFNMGLTRKIIRKMEGLEGSVDATVRANFFAFLNQTETQSFFQNNGVVAPDPNTYDGSRYTDARFLVDPVTETDYVRSTDTTDTGFQYLPEKAQYATDPGTVYSRLKEHVEPYDPTTVAAICGVTEEELDFVADAFIDNSRHMSSFLTGDPIVVGLQDPRDKANYRATTMMYAMGLTQHTCGAQNVKSFTILQILMGNMGRAGGGINALRGIHNVQGSTDMGLLYHLIPGYSGNPGTSRSVDVNAFGKYTDKLWGLPTRYANGALPDGIDTLGYDDAYGVSAGLQARGFYNMTLKWFGDYDVIHAMPYTNRTEKNAKRAAVDAIYDLWPKTNGQDHITMFRNMGRGDADPLRIKGCLVWGQNPAITEPNQGAVREGFYNLDTLVVVDVFETETAAVSRRPDGWTYLIPASSYVEEAGSVANSGRVLQWRERACAPKGNTKSDLELLLRMAYAFDKAGAFSHIKSVWEAAPLSWTLAGTTPVYDKLYKDQYGWSPADATAFEALSSTEEMWYSGSTSATTATVYGSEVVAEKIYQQCGTAPSGGGTMWLYLDAYKTDYTSRKHAAAPGGAAQADWQCYNRSKNRDTADGNGTLAYPGWGYSWLVNRRVLYNNGDVPGDNLDGYQGPDKAARLFVCKQPNTIGYANNNWRLVHGLSDMPDTCLPAITAPHVLPGRFPAHVEPYETPREDLAGVWGRNTRGGAAWDLVPADTNVAATGRSHDPADFPLILTSIRCVEHFQGGPITRNNPWNVECEPEPWVELNSVTAAALNLSDGEYVNIVTARGDSLGSARTITTGALAAGDWTKGFKVRIGAGTLRNQRVAPGVAAIPWHWGDRGLSTGARANDLCIDAGDANTTIPEYKACLCKIEKIPTP